MTQFLNYKILYYLIDAYNISIFYLINMLGLLMSDKDSDGNYIFYYDSWDTELPLNGDDNEDMLFIGPQQPMVGWYERYSYNNQENYFMINFFDKKLKHQRFKIYGYFYCWDDLSIDTILIRRQIRFRWVSLQHTMNTEDFFEWLKTFKNYYKEFNRIEHIIRKIMKIHVRNNRHK